MKTAHITFDNGDTITTSINGTDDEIRAYYLGKWFNLGTVDDDMHKAVSVDVLPDAYNT